MTLKLVLASHNQGKLAEMRAILEPAVPGLELVAYDGPEPIENGTTFLENALIKARAANLHTGLPAIADDSGLAVELLAGGRDNVESRRLLLRQLADIPDEHRGAAFICTIALVDGDSEVSFSGNWPGVVAREERGEHGHGYDPIFVPEGFEQTAAELEPELKNAFSHRSQALGQLIRFLNA